MLAVQTSDSACLLVRTRKTVKESELLSGLQKRLMLVLAVHL